MVIQKGLKVNAMMYGFMTLANDTVITHSEVKPDGTVKVYIETPDEKDCFHHMTCYLPEYKLEDIYGYTSDEVSYYVDYIRSVAHVIMDVAHDLRKKMV